MHVFYFADSDNLQAGFETAKNQNVGTSVFDVIFAFFHNFKRFRTSVVVIIIGQLHSTKAEFRFCTDSNPPCSPP